MNQHEEAGNGASGHMDSDDTQVQNEGKWVRPTPTQECVINRVGLRKGGKTGIQAAVWVRLFGVIDVQFRVLNGPDGVFVVGPNGEHRGPDGRRRFFKRFNFVDEDLKERVEAMILAAYREQLAEARRNEPPPMPGEFLETDDPE